MLHSKLVGVINEALMPRFRTKVEELLHKMPPKGTGEQYAAMLRNNGVTDDEIRWTKLGSLLKQPKLTKQEITDHLAQHGMPFAVHDQGDEGRKHQYEDYALKGGKNYGEKLLTMKGEELGYKSNHWRDAKDPVFHIRHQDFTDADGKELWLIEEIQSDWHQGGRKQGYDGGKERFQILYKNGALRVDRPEGNEFASESDAQEYIESSIPHIIRGDITIRKYKSGGIPDAPMKKNWEENAFKFALHQAVEANADRIGWITGQIAAERFDIAKQVDHLELTHSAENREDSYFKTGTPPYLLTGSYADRVVLQQRVELKDVEGVVGKEVAEKLLRQPEDEQATRTLKGDDIRIGGEGMRAAYDGRILSIAKKVAKATGATIGKVALPTAGERDKQMDDEDPHAGLTIISKDQMKSAADILLGVTEDDWHQMSDPPDESEDRSEEYANDAKEWVSNLHQAGKLLKKSIDDLVLFAKSAEWMAEASKVESEWGDDPATQHFMREVIDAFGWEMEPEHLEDAMAAYHGFVKKTGNKSKAKAIEVWYMDITPAVQDLVSKGMRLAFESVKTPDNWWLIGEDTKPKATKPWWAI